MQGQFHRAGGDQFQRHREHMRSLRSRRKKTGLRIHLRKLRHKDHDSPEFGKKYTDKIQQRLKYAKLGINRREAVSPETDRREAC